LFKAARSSSVGIHQKRDTREIELATALGKEELKIYGYS